MLGSRHYWFIWVETIQCPVWALEACSIQKAGLLPWPPAPRLARVGLKWWPLLNIFLSCVNFFSHIFKTSRGSLLAGLQAARRARRRNAPISFSIQACFALCGSL